MAHMKCPACFCGQVLTLTVGLLLAAGAPAQTAQADVKQTSPSANASKSAKATKKPAATDYKLTLEPRAMDLLKAVSTKLAAAKSMSFTAVVGYEYPSKLGPPIVYSTRYDGIGRRRDA